MDTSLLYPLIISLVLIALSFGAIFIGNKFGVKFINIAKTIVEFIAKTLESLDLKNDKVGLIISLITQGITYAIAINLDNDKETKVADALAFIKNISSGLGEELTEAELEVIKSALEITFIFIETLNIRSFKYKKIVKYAAKYSK
jgi:hypothetical protein